MYLDTHVVVWLYQGDLDRFSDKGLKILEENRLLVSPIVILEMEYLYEIEKIKADGPMIFEYLQSAIGLEACNLPFYRMIMESLDIDWTRDPFDRLIVAQARVGGEKLLTKDTALLKHTDLAVWD